MTATLERRQSVSLWERFCGWITSTENPKVGVGKVAVVLDHSICDSRKPCLAKVAHEFCYPSQTMLSLSLPMMGVTKKVADAGSVGG
jgi:hypothetical protein